MNLPIRRYARAFALVVTLLIGGVAGSNADAIVVGDFLATSLSTGSAIRASGSTGASQRCLLLPGNSVRVTGASTFDGTFTWWPVDTTQINCSGFSSGYLAATTSISVVTGASITATLQSVGCSAITLPGARTLKLLNSANTIINSAASPASFGGLVLNNTYSLEGWHTNSSLSPPQEELWGGGTFPLTTASSAYNVCRRYPYSTSNATLLNATLGTQAFGVTVQPGSNMSVVLPITNARDNALAVRVRYDFDRDGSAVAGGTSSQQTIANGATVNFTLPVTASAVTGGYYAVFRVETETSASNWNVTDSWARTSLFTVSAPSLPDLVPQSVSFSPGSILSPGQGFTANWILANVGVGSAASTPTGLRITTTANSIGQASENRGVVYTGPVSGNGSVAQNSSSISPALAAPGTPGTYYLVVIADNSTTRISQSNTVNDWVSVPFTVQAATGSIAYSINPAMATNVARLYTNGSGTCSGPYVEKSGASNTFPTIANGSYCVEAFNTNSAYSPSGAVEYWGKSLATVTSGGSTSITISRTEPRASLFRFINASTNQVATTVQVGTLVKLRAYVDNPGAFRSVSAQFQYRYAEAPATVYQCPSLTYSAPIGSSGIQVECSFQANSAGTIQRQLQIWGDGSSNFPTDSWGFSTTDVLNVTSGATNLSLAITAVTVGQNNIPDPATDPIKVLRGQKVSIRVRVTDGSNQPVNGATVVVDRSMATWLAATPAVATTPLPNGEYIVAFYIPTSNDTAPLDTSKSLGFIKASFAATSGQLVGRSLLIDRPPYGLTIVIHGFQRWETKCVVSPLNDIAAAVLMRAGRGKLWNYDYNTERFVSSGVGGVVSTRDNDGEQVISVNWCDVSNNGTPGYAEATAHQFYAALKTYSPVMQTYGSPASSFLRDGNSRPIHIVAHSFGSGVAFQLLRRLRDLEGFANVQLTTLDTHDFRQTQTYIGLADATVNMPNVNISRLNAITPGLQFDNYYQRLTRYAPTIPSGRCVTDMSNERLDVGLSATFGPHWDFFAEFHTAVHRWYLGTILPDTLTDKLNDTIVTQVYGSTANRYLFGYAKSRIGGGANFTVPAYSAACPDGTGNAEDSQPDSADFEVMDGTRYLLSSSGVFDSKFHPDLFYIRPEPRPGYRTGAGNAERHDVAGKTGMRVTGSSGYWDPYGALPKSSALETRMTYIGPNSQSLRFSAYVPTLQSTGALAVSTWRPGTSGPGDIGSVDTAALSPAAWKQICLNIPQPIRDADTAAILGFYASGTTEFTITELELSPVPCSSFSLTVRSTASGSETSGVTVTLSPAAVGSVQSLTTNATSPAFELYAPNVQVTLEAPAQSGGGNFTSWSYCDATDAALRRCTINMNGHRGAVVNYTSVAPVNGQCGSSHNAVLSSAPSVNLCSAGTASPVTGNGPWNWSCGGTGGGTTASCVAQLADTTPNPFTFTNVVDVAPSTVVTSNVVTISGINVASPISIVNGTYSIGCGATSSSTASLIANGQTVCVRHSASASFATQTTTTLTVGGVSGTFTSTTASSGTPVNGQCGTANGQIASTIPTSNLCSVGVSSFVQGAGPWTWTCVGANGGSTATCSAPIQTWIMTAGAGAGGAISPTSQTVNSNASGTITVTPDSGYGIASVTGCGGTLAGNVYTTAAVVANCNVYASFTPTIGPVNGVCGSANGGIFMAAPTTNLCVGSVSVPVSGSGPWNWVCPGSNGGSNATCSAQLADTTPDPFSFPTQAGVGLSTLVTSNTVTITGINVPSSISVVGATYSIGCAGTFTALPSTISSGQSVCLRLQSSTAYSTATTAALTVGTVQGIFSVQTRAAADITPPVMNPLSCGDLITNQTSKSITFSGSDDVGVTRYECKVNIWPLVQTCTSPVPTGSILSDGTYSMSIRAFDAAGNASAPATCSWRIDTTAPTAPTNLVASNVTSSSVSLSWTASTDTGGSGVNSYQILRCTGAGCTNFLAVAAVAGNSYVDAGRVANTTYVYRVRAVDNATNFADSNLLSVTMLAAATGCLVQAVNANSLTNDALAAGCDSVHRPGAYAKYFSFTLAAASDVSIDMSSAAFDTYLYLLSGNGLAGAVVAQNDDSNGTTNSRIFQANLAAGSYTIEATSFSSVVTGAFTLQLSAVPATTPVCYPTGTMYGAWRGFGTIGYDGNQYTVGDTIGYDSGDADGDCNIPDSWYVPAGTAAGDAEMLTYMPSPASSAIDVSWSGCIGNTNASYHNVGVIAPNPAFTGVPNSGQGLWTGTWDVVMETSWERAGLFVVATGTSGYDRLPVTAATLSSNGYCGNFRLISSPAKREAYFNGNLVYQGSASTITNRMVAVLSYDKPITLANIVFNAGAPLDVTPPTAPTNLAASSVTSSSISLSWTASTDTGGSGVLGYQILRCTGAGCTDFVDVGAVATTAYVDTGRAANTTYVYRVRAVDNATNFGDPSSVSVTTTAVAGGCFVTSVNINSTTNGTLEPGCDSIHRLGRYAKYFSFTLAATSEVTIDLSSAAVDTFLLLLSGNGLTGSVIAYNDDFNNTTNSRIFQANLAAGSYTVESTSYYAAEAGAFTLQLSAVLAAGAGPGTLDSTMSVTGANSGLPTCGPSVGDDYLHWVWGAQPPGKVIAHTADGKYVTIGYNQCAATLAVFRYTAAGALDATFGAGGIVSLGVNQPDPRDVAVQSNGRIVVMLDGNLDASSSGAFLVGLNTSGAVDTSFGAGGRVALPFNSRGGLMVVGPDDKIHMVGNTYTSSPLVYVRLLSNGLPDNSVVGSGTTFGAHALALPSKIVERVSAPKLVSNATSGDGLMFALQDDTSCPAGSANDSVGPRPMFLRFATNGATTIALGGANSSGGVWWCGFPQPVEATNLTPSGSDVSPDGKLYLQMSAQTSFDDPVGALTYVYRFNADMTIDASWGTGGRLALPAFPGQSAAAGVTFGTIGVGLKVYPDGRIVSAVREDKSDATGRLSTTALVGLLPTGAIDAAFGTGGITRFDAFAQGLDAQDDGRIVVASLRYLWRLLGYPAASPSTLSFSTIAPGANSVQAVKISNSASPTLSITGTVVSAPYSVVGSNCPAQLVSGASCTLSVMFAPTVAGSYLSTLTVNTSGRALSVPLRGVSEAVKTCSLDVSGDGAALAETDGVLLTRYLLGFRGAALVNGVTLGASRPDAASVELFMGNASAFDMVGRSVAAPNAFVDGLILMRLMQGVSDSALLNGIAIPSGAQFASAADIRANVNVKCGTGF